MEGGRREERHTGTAQSAIAAASAQSCAVCGLQCPPAAKTAATQQQHDQTRAHAHISTESASCPASRTLEHPHSPRRRVVRACGLVATHANEQSPHAICPLFHNATSTNLSCAQYTHHTQILTSRLHQNKSDTTQNEVRDKHVPLSRGGAQTAAPHSA